MLKLIKNKTLILIIVIVIIIICVSAYFINNKTREGFAITLPTKNYVTGRYFRIEKDTSAVNNSDLTDGAVPKNNKQNAKYLQIGGILIYDDKGVLINLDRTKGTLKDDFGVTNNNCLNIIQYNTGRTLLDAAIKMPATGSSALYNYLVWGGNTGNITHTLDSENPWWEYDFGRDVNIAGFEILPRAECCAIRSNFLKVKVFANSDGLNRNTPLNISDTFSMFPNIKENGSGPPSAFFTTPQQNVSYFYITPKPIPIPTPTQTSPQPTPIQQTPTTSILAQLPEQVPSGSIITNIVSGENLLNDCERNTTQDECIKSNKCNYTNTGCYSKSSFSILPQTNTNNTFTCTITPNTKSNYKLSCSDINLNNKKNFVLTNLSTDKECLVNNSNCNLIRKITDRKQQQPYTLTFINNSIVDDAILDNEVIKEMTNDFKDKLLTGLLYASDIHKSKGQYAKMPVPYTVVKDIPLSNYKDFSLSVAQVDSNIVNQVYNQANENKTNINTLSLPPQALSPL